MLRLQDAQTQEYSRIAGAEPLPGYRLIEPLGHGGFGEVWKCEVPGGLFKAIKFVYGNLDDLGDDSAQAEQELGALRSIRAIRHPFLLTTERVEIVGGQVIIVMELADKSLEDRFRECREAGHAGIPREQLLAYMLEAAEALDLLNHQHNLQHLDIKPRNIFLVANHVKVADFGLVMPFSEADSSKSAQPGGVSPHYTSPEVFMGKISRHSDQYSLAILYQEMLTGQLPFEGKSGRQLMMRHLTGQPNLEPLGPADQAVIARALAKDPQQRFPCCLALAQALATGAAQHPVAPPEPAPPMTPARTTLSGIFRQRGPTLDEKSTHSTVSVSGSADQTTKPHDALCPPMPDYKFVTCIVQGPLGEVWQVKDHEGRKRLAQFLPGFATPDDQATARLAARLGELRHTALPPLELYRNPVGQLVLVTDSYPRALRDRYQEYSTQGATGIPRRELLGYLTTTAAALDELWRSQQLRHLGLNPRNLMLHEGQPLLPGFGLIELVWLPTGQPAAPLNLRYAAPELHEPMGDAASDQYSLALIYAEMLTGVNPRPGRTGSRHGASAPIRMNLELLSTADRDILTRALSADPQARYASCTELVEALKGAKPAGAQAENARVSLPPVVPYGSLRGEPPPAHMEMPPLAELIHQQLTAGTEIAQVCQYQQFQYTITAAGALEHRFAVSLFAGSLRLKLGGFRETWKAQVVQRDDHKMVMRVQAPSSLWQRYVGHTQGLEIKVSVPPTAGAGTGSRLAEATVRIKAFGGDQALEMLAQVGPELVASLRSFLQASPERRRHPRWALLQPLRVYPVFPDLEVGEPIAGMGKDLSPGGIGLVLPQRPPSAHVYVHLNASAHLAPWAVLVRVFRVQAVEDGWFEIGAAFVP